MGQPDGEVYEAVDVAVYAFIDYERKYLSPGFLASPHIAPVSRKMAHDCRDAGGRAMPGAIAEDRCDWTPGWTETNSRSY